MEQPTTPLSSRAAKFVWFAGIAVVVVLFLTGRDVLAMRGAGGLTMFFGVMAFFADEMPYDEDEDRPGGAITGGALKALAVGVFLLGLFIAWHPMWLLDK